MKIVAYRRVSTTEQSQNGVSLDAQEAKLRAFCDLYGHELVAIYEDPGASAKDLRRPGLQAALAALDAGEAEGLLVVKLDRLTRSVRDLSALLESHFSGRHALLSVGEQLDTSTAGGRMVLSILTVISEWERAVISERTSAALQHLKAQGQHIGAPGLGYELVDGDLRRNDAEQATVKRIRELNAEGLSLREIASVLKAEQHKSKRGGEWHPNTINRVIKRAEAQG